MGWGSAQQVRDPMYAAKKFFSTLKGVGDRDRLSLSMAAQAVQRSAFPSAYAKHESSARGLLARYGGKAAGTGPPPTATTTTVSNGLGPFGRVAPEQSTTPGLGTDNALGLGTPTPVGLGPLDAAFQMTPINQDVARDLGQESGAIGAGVKGNNVGNMIVSAAKNMLGLPYVWGGTSPSSGVDCSGLVQAAYKAAGLSVPRVSFAQANSGRRVSFDKLRPGDLVAWDNSARNNGADHIAIWLGNGQILEAPKPGARVRTRKLGRNEGAWGVNMASFW